MNLKINLLLLFLFVSIVVFAQRQPNSALEIKMSNAGLTDIGTLDKNIRVDLKYATTDNFTKTILYDTLRIAYLQPLAAQKLAKAQSLLKKTNPNCNLLVYDAARPLSVQKKMYKVVQGTPQASYVADPSKIGMHNYGLAVDLTICNSDGTPLDMGTSFDYFGKAAGIRDEEGLIREGLLTKKQVENRKLLRKVMTDAGFLAILGEWWHFNAVSKRTAVQSYKVIQ